MEKILASYLWRTQREDVNKWVDECPQCQQHNTLKTVAPVLQPIVVREAWSVLWIDLIGPLPTTVKGKRDILTATDLFTKWVVAKSMYTKTAEEMARKISNILLDLGLVERIITDQGLEFVDQASGQDERKNRTIKTALSKHCGKQQNDWDVHLKGVFSINTTKQRSTKYTPYCVFGRHPRSPGVNTGQQEEHNISVVVNEVTEQQIEAQTTEVSDLHQKLMIFQNIQVAQDRQKKDDKSRKGRNVKAFHFKVGEEVLKAIRRKYPVLQDVSAQGEGGKLQHSLLKPDIQATAATPVWIHEWKVHLSSAPALQLSTHLVDCTVPKPYQCFVCFDF